ncbi:hypothetical protein ANCDUO_20423 [Ancylostoma duodenale]|uniref:Uncharacterized protein n=1 Tax=Ancylostoma duodenale TaxID=51022 RepID=A0A0C2CI86_9BILA|nr:hypothetical protein ANCDUO_20423 [Ancylostoma duodenale]
MGQDVKWLSCPHVMTMFALLFRAAFKSVSVCDTSCDFSPPDLNCVLVDTGWFVCCILLLAYFFIFILSNN